MLKNDKKNFFIIIFARRKETKLIFMTDKWFTRQRKGLLTYSLLFIPFLTVQGQDVTTDKPTSVPMQTIQVAKNKLPADGGVVA